MTLLYPSSVPDWNNLRWLTPDTVDTNDTIVQCIRLPVQYLPYFWGALSLLAEVDNWEQFGTLNSTEMVDIYNNEVELVSICQLVASCITESNEVKESLIQVFLEDNSVRNALQEAVAGNMYGQTDGVSLPPQVSDMDYVWGGLVGALPVYQDAISEFFLLVNGAVDAADAILGLSPYLTPIPTWFTLVEGAFTFGLSQLENYMTQTAFEEEFLCNIFDLICQRGLPYYLTDDDITSAMIATGTTVPGFPSAGEIPWPYFNFAKFKQLFAINSDTPNNNWEALCGCNPTDLYDVVANAWDYLGTPSGVYIRVGDNVEISASPTDLWTCAPSTGATDATGIAETYTTTVKPNTRAYSLIGKIGTGSWFYIGLGTTFQSTVEGELYLCANDANNANAFLDNTGSINVSVGLNQA